MMEASEQGGTIDKGEKGLQLKSDARFMDDEEQSVKTERVAEKADEESGEIEATEREVTQSSFSTTGNSRKLSKSGRKRFADSFAQFTRRLKQAAAHIDKQNTAEFLEIQKRRKRKKEKQLEREVNINLFKTQNEKLVKLKKLKVEVIRIKFVKENKLKKLVRYHKILVEKNKREEEDSPTQILNISNDLTGDVKEKYVDDSKLLYRGDQDEHSHQCEETMTYEEMQLTARTRAEEELKMAKELKRYMMEKIVKEREKGNTSQETIEGEDEDKDQSVDNGIEGLDSGLQISSICTLLNCSEDELYDLNDSDPLNDSKIDSMENSSMDINDVQNNIDSIVKDISGYNALLLQIDAMQLMFLAENAATSGKDEFSSEGIQLDEAIMNNHVSTTNHMDGAIMLAENAAALGEDEFRICFEHFSNADEVPTGSSTKKDNMREDIIALFVKLLKSNQSEQKIQ